jgi:hypothetical protein
LFFEVCKKKGWGVGGEEWVCQPTTCPGGMVRGPSTPYRVINKFVSGEPDAVQPLIRWGKLQLRMDGLIGDIETKFHFSESVFYAGTNIV